MAAIARSILSLPSRARPLGALVAALVASAAAGAQDVRLAFVQVPASAPAATGGIAESILAGRYPSGARVVVAALADVGGTVRAVAEGFDCAADPAFDLDGRKLCFAGRRAPGGPLELWQAELEGELGDPRLLFEARADCVAPLYTPNRRLVFAALYAGEYEEHGGLRSFSLYEWSRRSDEPTRLTFNPSSDFEPALLADGRIAYSSWQHVGNQRWPRGGVALMLINSDGTGVFPLTDRHRDPWLERGVLPWGAGRFVYVRAASAAGFGAGELVAGSLDDALGEPRTLVALAQHEVADAAPLPDGGLVVAARPTDGSRATFGLYLWRDGALELLYDDPAQHELSPAPAVASAPERLISTVEPGTAHGWVLVLDCRETDRSDQGDPRREPVAKVRVLEGLPLHGAGAAGPTFLPSPGHDDEPLVHAASATGTIPTRILGEVAPAADGSLYLKVPADRPLRLQLIDREGFALVNERAWFWVRPNERRVCIGCHEDRELAPRNVAPLAAAREPADLTDARGWRSLSFQSDVRPILEKTCAQSGCHVPPAPTADMVLLPDSFGDGDAALAQRFGSGYANLLARQAGKPFGVGGRRVHPGDARASPLLWMLYGEQLGPAYERAPFDRPLVEGHPDGGISPAELERFRAWVDLGAVYDESAPRGPWPYAIPRREKPAQDEEGDGR